MLLINALMALMVIFYYYLLKSCNFNYNDLLLLINNSVSIKHCNDQPCIHINGIC